jgi:Zn-dependent protease
MDSQPNPAPMPPLPPVGSLVDLTSEQVTLRELRISDINSKHDQSKHGLERIERGLRLSIILFIATALSTFWVGCTHWEPLAPQYASSLGAMQQAVVQNWPNGLRYMCAVLAILLTHEMGHFLMTLRHRIPASYPLCIPVPINPIGTMGAVIGMEGLKANRKEIFDIGLAGPLAGLAVAIPILWHGVRLLNLQGEPYVGEIQLYNPVIARWMIEWLHPEWAGRTYWIGIHEVNPYFMAGWVGMLVTGLNMLPVSQLDGGHTIYGLFGKDSFRIARGFTILAILYVIVYIEQAAMWTLMLILVILMGIHHPPTANDNVELDDRRWILGMLSLSIPILCFPLLGLKQ